MVDNTSRRGAVEMGTVLMVLSFAIIGGFMFWLSGQAADERAAAAAAVVVDTVTEDPSATVTTVAAEDIQMDASPYEGQEIRLAGLEIQSVLGTQGFWLGLPNGNPFLVSMSPDVMAEGLTLGSGKQATVVGLVHAMNDSTLTAWTEAGTIQAGDRIVAEFATHYMEAVDVLVSGAAGAGAADGNDN